MHNYEVWETQDGRMLELSEMHEVHIQNCINMLQRQIDAIKEDAQRHGFEYLTVMSEYILHKRKYIKSFEKELRKRLDNSDAVCYNNYSKKNNNIKKGDNYMDLNGSIGGFMVKKMIEAQERQMQGGFIKPADSSNQSNKKGDNVMKATGIVRRIDDLGRVVIPKEIRRKMGINEGDPLEVFTSDKGIELRKYKDANMTAEDILRTVRKNDVTFITQRPHVVAVSKQSTRNGGVIIKTGTATCNPSDSFNEQIGKAIAYQRMMGETVSQDLMD